MSLPEAVGFTYEFDDMRLVGQTIQQSDRQALIAKDLRPIGKPKIRSNDQGYAFIKRRAELEHQLLPCTGKGDEAQFINHNEMVVESLVDEWRDPGFIERRLRLKVNEEKSAVGLATQRKFLGFSFY